MIQRSLDSRKNGVADSDDDSQDDSLKPALPSALSQSPEISASVPRGWNWSTF